MLCLHLRTKNRNASWSYYTKSPHGDRQSKKYLIRMNWGQDLRAQVYAGTYRPQFIRILYEPLSIRMQRWPILGSGARESYCMILYINLLFEPQTWMSGRLQRRYEASEGKMMLVELPSWKQQCPSAAVGMNRPELSLLFCRYYTPIGVVLFMLPGSLKSRERHLFPQPDSETIACNKGYSFPQAGQNHSPDDLDLTSGIRNSIIFSLVVLGRKLNTRIIHGMISDNGRASKTLPRRQCLNGDTSTIINYQP